VYIIGDIKMSVCVVFNTIEENLTNHKPYNNEVLQVLDINNLDMDKLEVKNPYNSSWLGDFKYYYNNEHIINKPIFSITTDKLIKFNVYSPEKEDKKGFTLLYGFFVKTEYITDFNNVLKPKGKYRGIFYTLQDKYFNTL